MVGTSLRFVIICFVFGFLLSTCDHHTKKTDITETDSLTNNVGQEETNKVDNFNDSIDQTIKETIDYDSLPKQAKKNLTSKNLTKPNNEELYQIERYIEFPGDMHMNGKPLVYQLNMKQSTLLKHPDTLQTIAISNYESFKNFYPRSIACDFENGTSTEFTDYPKTLTFKFQLFENNKALSPYEIKLLTVIRTENNELKIKY